MVSKKKCTGCHMCELACSAQHEAGYRPSVALLHIDCNPTTAEIKGSTCLQTGCAKCEEACKEGAIWRKEITTTVGDETTRGIVLAVDESKCTNCGDCYEVCPYGVIFEHPDRKKAIKCDLCDGDPQCWAFCQNPYVLAVSLKVDKADKALAQA